MRTVPKLEARLQAVAEQIRCHCHADIGSDHALLPLHLLLQGRVGRVIAVEKNPGPYERTRQALKGYKAEARLGDGFEPLEPGEVQSASVCGMGGTRILKMLQRAQPDKIPELLLLQPSRDFHLVRGWAREHGYHLIREQMVKGHYDYVILSLRRDGGEDPAYEGVPVELGLHFGPRLLKDKHPLLLKELSRRRSYFERLVPTLELERVKRALKFIDNFRPRTGNRS